MSIIASGNITAVTCPSTAKFNAISANTFFAGMNPGWNLGNTLDAIETVRIDSIQCLTHSLRQFVGRLLE